MLVFQASKTKAVLDNATQVKDVVWQSLNNLTTSIISQLPYLIAGAIVLLLFWLLSGVVRKIFLSATKHTRLDERLRILFSRLIVTLVIVIGFFTTLTVIVPSFAFGDFIAGLGLTSLAIGFAIKDILHHLISGVLILWQQPFRIGDYISVKENEGWVHFIGVRATSLRKSNGEMVLIPNGDIYSSPMKVRRGGTTYPMTMKFKLGYDTDIDTAKHIARTSLISSLSVVDDPAPKVVITDLAPEGICMTANFRINSNQNRPLEVYDDAASKLLGSLTEAGIHVFPPPPIHRDTSAQKPPANDDRQFSN